MINFKSYLTEGGNIQIGEVKPEPISIEDRGNKTKDVHQFFHYLNNSSGNKLFGQHERGLSNLTSYSGSTKHIMNRSISSDELSQYKKSFSDIDIQVPKE